MRVLFFALSASIAFWGWSTELSPAAFRCTGQMKGEICWLRDSRWYAVASWHFPGVSPGPWTLALEAVSHDPCADCPAGRAVTVQVFWRESPAEPWNWQFVVMRPEEGTACVVRAELPLRLGGPELWLLVRRALLCEPHLGFSRFSARLHPQALVELPSPPPKPVPPTPPPPPVTPPPPACPLGPLFACVPGAPPAECVPATIDLATVVRLPLPETYGPGDAHPLDLGHYVGEMGPGDWQDWYKFSVVKGEARLVYFRALGDLAVDLYLVHDPCGTDLGVCLNVPDEAALHAPCQAGVECLTIPDGPTECFPGPRCGFFVRVVWRSGSGKYFLSVLPVEISP